MSYITEMGIIINVLLLSVSRSARMNFIYHNFRELSQFFTRQDFIKKLFLFF